MTQPCPTAKELRSLVDGSLSDLDAQSIELHIERCEACQHAIQELAADGSFWQSAAKNLSDDKIVGPGLDRVIETLQHQSREDAEEIGEAIELKLSFIEPPVEPGTIGRLRHYDILRVAGRGGMGIVLKAFDRSLRRIVAIKLLAPHLAGNGQARQRFVREGRAAAAISHEHVVTIHAVEESPPFLVMQYVHGETLEERIHRNGSLDVRDAVRIALQIAQGLAAAHAQGVVHRDIKPANILLENGVARVRITDFGLARAIDDASLTQSGVVAGTPQYMAPEQASGDAIDERADLFSLGSVLYTMLAGHAPFRATTAMGVLKRLCDNAARSIKEINPETPDWLVVVINRLHAKRPADRFHSATEVAALLERGMAAMQTGTTPASGRASALRADTTSVHAAPREYSFAQEVPVKPTENYSAVPPQSPNAVRMLQNEVNRHPVWLVFLIVGLMIMPIVRLAGIIGVLFGLIAYLVPRWMPHATARLFNSCAFDASSNSSSTLRESFLLLGPLRQCGWLSLWLLPVMVWVIAFFLLNRSASSGLGSDLLMADQNMLAVLLSTFTTWLLIAVYWFRRRHKDGSFLFEASMRRKGIMTVAGLATIFFAYGYGTWKSKVYLPASQMIVMNKGKYWMPHFDVRIDLDGAVDGNYLLGTREGIHVFIDDQRRSKTMAYISHSLSSVPAPNAGSYPWHATVGKQTFASGYVTLESGRTAVIRVPRPRLINLLSGRWKSETVATLSQGGQSTPTENVNMEFEFTAESVVAADRTPGSKNSCEFFVHIDESVSPALIDLTASNGDALCGIIHFKPNDIDPRLTTNETGTEYVDGTAMGAELNVHVDVSPPYISLADRLLICLSHDGAPRPSEFKSDPDHNVTLYQLIRSDTPEPHHH